jgi:hypothetical protein
MLPASIGVFQTDRLCMKHAQSGNVGKIQHTNVPGCMAHRGTVTDEHLERVLLYVLCKLLHGLDQVLCDTLTRL